VTSIRVFGDGLEGGYMHRFISFTRRSYRLLAMSGVLAGMMVAGIAALAPAGAEAWAWSDSCGANVYNKSGSQSSVRPVAYIPVLPSASGEASFGAFLIVGIPTTGSVPFFNTGYPVPAYGCHTLLTFVNPGPNVTCTMDAPTEGANKFSCNGNSRVKILRDDDDIFGDVFIAEPKSGKPLRPPQPHIGRDALRTSQLVGQGWSRSEKITSLGLAGEAMAADTLPANCHSRGGEATPESVESEELVRDDGAQGVGAVVQTYANSTEAEKTERDALSEHSISCLARFMTSKTLDTSVTIKSLPVSRLGSGVEGSRLKIHQSGTGKTDYLDVLGEVHGNQDAIELDERAGTPPTASSDGTDLAALRIRG
jgi:hypothetical protein